MNERLSDAVLTSIASGYERPYLSRAEEIAAMESMAAELLELRPMLNSIVVERHRVESGVAHAEFAHPDFEYATTRGPRKDWEYADEPPEGEGWERNVDAGRDGWVRFDFHEESYWRRRWPQEQP